MNPLLPIITGYAAKNLSSGVFVAGRTQESMEATDLNFSFIKYVKSKIDFDKKEVTSKFLWNTSKSVYIDGYGCVLVNDFTADEIKNRPYPELKMLPGNPDTIPWPMGDLITDTIPQGIDMDQLNQSLGKAFADTIPQKGTFAVAVVYKGQLVAEKYKKGFSAKNRFLSWSMAKSFMNAWVGILENKGIVDLDTPVDIDDWQDDARQNITLNNLLHMTSGLKWNEDYGSNSDVNIMLHKVGDMGKYTMEKPFEYPADSIWKYSSGNPNLVSLLIRQTLNNDSVYDTFLHDELFNKIGMRSAVFEMDASGTFVGSSYLYATMRDFARFGLLYLDNGNWLGDQILDPGWVDYTKQEAPGSKGKYGAFFWLNLKGSLYPDVPEDLFLCEGHDGQYIAIIPSKNLVVVRTGFSKKGDFDINAFLADIVHCVK